MKLYRQIEPGEIIPENAVWLNCGATMPTECAGEKCSQAHPIYLLPILASDDPDAGTKAMWSLMFPYSEWRHLGDEGKEAYRAAATAAVAATVPQLVDKLEELNQTKAQASDFHQMLRRICEVIGDDGLKAVERYDDYILRHLNSLRSRLTELQERYDDVTVDYQRRIAELENHEYAGELKAAADRIAELEAAQNPQPRLVPATLELMQKHGTETVCYRNGEKPKRIWLLEDGLLPIASMDAGDYQMFHSRDGRDARAEAGHGDLVMPEPAPRMKELWVGAGDEKVMHIIRIEIPEEKSTK